MTDTNFHLTLLGAVELRAPSGAVVTPRLRKSRALLAYLAMADGRRIERSTLENLLWSDRAPRQARDSLKQSLCDIRRAFGAARPCPLETDGGPVHLALDRITVDALDAPPTDDPPFLEGIDIACPAFVAWLVQQRRRPHPTAQAAPVDDTWLRAPRRFRIEIATAGTDGGPSSPSPPGAHGLLTMARDCLVRGLDQTGLFAPTDAAVDGAVPPDLRLVANAYVTATEAMISLSVMRMDLGTTIWAWVDNIPLPARDSARIYTLIAQSIEQLCDAVWKENQITPFASPKSPALAAMKAIRLISRLTPANLAAAETALLEAMDGSPSPSLYAWRAYLTAYQLEKNGDGDLAGLRDVAMHFSAHAMELDRNSPLTRALVAHVYGFVLRDPDRVREMLAPVRGLVGQSAMLADTVSLTHFYAGRYDEASAHAQLACKLGRWNPMLYAFTTVLSASQLMLGKYDDAIRNGKRALAQHPPGIGFQYEPTLRTLAAAYCFADRKAEGRAALDVLERQTGTDTNATLRDMPDTLFPNPDVFHRVRDGIRGLRL